MSKSKRSRLGQGWHTVRGLSEPSEDGPRVLTLQGNRQSLEKLFGPITRRHPKSRSVQSAQFSEGGNGGRAPPAAAGFNHQRDEL